MHTHGWIRSYKNLNSFYCIVSPCTFCVVFWKSFSLWILKQFFNFFFSLSWVQILHFALFTILNIHGSIPSSFFHPFFLPTAASGSSCWCVVLKRNKAHVKCHTDTTSVIITTTATAAATWFHHPITAVKKTQVTKTTTTTWTVLASLFAPLFSFYHLNQCSI